METPPDLPPRPPLDVARLAALDADLFPGLHVEVVAETGSTNALVADRARAGAAEGLVVVAEHQTAGRGRLERSWVAPTGSALTFSVLLRPTVPTRQWPWLPLLAGHELDRALRAAGYDTGVKWPNDVLIEGRKVAGILCEVIDTPAVPGSPAAAVVGIGLNVAMSQAELPVSAATSLLLAGGSTSLPDRTDLLVLVLQSFWEGYRAWQAGGAAAAARLVTAYAGSCVTLGRQVRVDRPSGAPLVGTATEVDAAGRLVVAAASGPVAVSAGDVVHVRPV